MIESMLEPHMKTTISASQMQVGVAFLISGGVYMVANPLIGKVKIQKNYPTLFFCVTKNGLYFLGLRFDDISCDIIHGW